MCVTTPGKKKSMSRNLLNPRVCWLALIAHRRKLTWHERALSSSHRAAAAQRFTASNSWNVIFRDSPPHMVYTEKSFGKTTSGLLLNKSFIVFVRVGQWQLQVQVVWSRQGLPTHCVSFGAIQWRRSVGQDDGSKSFCVEFSLYSDWLTATGVKFHW